MRVPRVLASDVYCLIYSHYVTRNGSVKPDLQIMAISKETVIIASATT